MVQRLAPDATLRNYAKEGLTRAEIERIVKAAGGTADVLNTRHKTAKESGWKDKAPSKTAFLKAAVEENNLLRRPILVKGSKVVVGKDLDAIRDLLV
ncbi:MAG: ArsC/Spx/MgsR family protein [Planctomycetota bacterium]|nr:ArsC/Spx/MgsR family protein [Planctomycetota bacterium]